MRAEPALTSTTMTDLLTADQRLRYARQIALPQWGVDGQLALLRARVLIVGLGGLGAPVATYLAGAGVGALTLNDFDRVDASNLPRQPLHDTSAVGSLKTDSAARALARLNPGIQIETLDRRLTHDELTDVVARHDLVVDASDNFSTRFAVNQTSVETCTPLVSVAAIRFEGQLAFFRRDLAAMPCYACLYSSADEVAEDCAGQGVFTPLVGIMGSMAALMALKWLLGLVPAAAHTDVLCFDAMTLSQHALRLRQDPHCITCAKA